MLHFGKPKVDFAFVSGARLSRLSITQIRRDAAMLSVPLKSHSLWGIHIIKVIDTVSKHLHKKNSSHVMKVPISKKNTGRPFWTACSSKNTVPRATEAGKPSKTRFQCLKSAYFVNNFEAFLVRYFQNWRIVPCWDRVLEDLPLFGGCFVIFNGTSGVQKGYPVIFMEFGSIIALAVFFCEDVPIQDRLTW